MSPIEVMSDVEAAELNRDRCNSLRAAMAVWDAIGVLCRVWSL